MRDAAEKRANVWTLTLHLNRMATDTDLEDLDAAIRQREEREPALPFIWQRRGCTVTVRTQGDVGLLIEIAEWALDNTTSPGPTGFDVSRMYTRPLVMMRDWKGHAGE